MSDKGSPQHLVAGQAIPVRRIADISNLPTDYSTTPGGSIFSTTPGGTRIFYDRSFLLQCRNSPLTKSPPPNMAKIPGVTSPGSTDIPKENKAGTPTKEKRVEGGIEENPQFDMDM